jgi:hypothetical protein
MKRIAFALVCLAGLLVADTADARGRIFGRRSRGYAATSYAAPSIYSSPQEAAEAKAQILANAGYGYHPPGGFGGGYREGWGFSTVSAEAAMWGTCFGGSCLSARGRAQVWSPMARGWFAINIW